MQRYFLFVRRKDYPAYMAEFERIKANREKGKSPVFCELRSAKTNMVENVPYTLLAGAFIVLGTLAVKRMALDELLSIAVVLVFNSFAWTLAGFIFTLVKHRLRKRFLRRLGIEPTEDNIAVLESMEYQTV